jgi:predicted DsbA family dithiol-disulfide isomerase
MYLNPFCAHCRATHARLGELLKTYDAPVRVKWVYVWASQETPLWAWACAAAREAGIEEAVFEELLQASRDDPWSVRAAAERGGLSKEALDAALQRDDLREGLAANRKAVVDAEVKGLPTLDIGRRRLMGEQSEDELREALDAARPAK